MNNSPTAAEVGERKNVYSRDPFSSGRDSFQVEFYWNVETGEDHIRMQCIGETDRNTIWDFPADLYKEEYPEQWNYYSQITQNQERVAGIRLDMLRASWLQPETVDQLHMRGIFTLENLIAIDDNQAKILKLKNFSVLRERAKEYLDSLSHLGAEGDKLEETVEDKPKRTRKQAVEDTE